MATNVQDLNFTRYVYQFDFISHENSNTFCNPEKMQRGDFDQFILVNTIYPFGLATRKRNNLCPKITIEPHKGINTKTKGAILYLQNEIPNVKDETGLWPTKYDNTYYGDFYEVNSNGTKVKDLILLQAVPETKELFIDVFYGHYPRTKKNGQG
jgi:hypothetical protein